MGSSDSKLQEASAASSSQTAASTAAAKSDDADSAVIVRAPNGVQLRQINANNYLGRLADAKKFSGGLSKLRTLTRRAAGTETADYSGGSAGSGHCRTPALSSSGRSSPTSTLYQQAPQSSMPPMTSTPIWSQLAGGHYQYHQQQQHHHHHYADRHHRHRRHQQRRHDDLTTLLARGFDPVEYDRRQRERQCCSHRRHVANVHSAAARQKQQEIDQVQCVDEALPAN